MKKTIPPEELLLLEEMENSAPKTTITVKEAVTEFFENSFHNDVIVVGRIHEVFENVVGSDVVKHVKVKHVRDNILFLETDHGAWLKQIQFISQNIINGVCEELGEGTINTVEINVRMTK